MFADDILLFAEASLELLQVVINCLNLFCANSRQKVYFHKSQIFVSLNVDAGLTLYLSKSSSIPLTKIWGNTLECILFMGELMLTCTKVF